MTRTPFSKLAGCLLRLLLLCCCRPLNSRQIFVGLMMVVLRRLRLRAFAAAASVVDFDPKNRGSYTVVQQPPEVFPVHLQVNALRSVGNTSTDGPSKKLFFRTSTQFIHLVEYISSLPWMALLYVHRVVAACMELCMKTRLSLLDSDIDFFKAQITLYF